MTGLTPRDFTVWDNGRPQTISTFSEVSGELRRGPALGPHTFSNQVGSGAQGGSDATLDASTLGLSINNDTRTGLLDVAGFFRNDAGDVVGKIARSALEIKIARTQYEDPQKRTFVIRESISVPAGGAKLRFVAFSRTSSRAGTLTIALDTIE